MTCALRIILFCAVLTAAIVSQADALDNPHITVIVRYPGELSKATIAGAEGPAARIFEKARVTLQWRNCPEHDGTFSDPLCAGPYSPAELVVHVVPRAQKATGPVFGIAFLNVTGGVYADVFLDRVQGIQDQAPNISFSRLLGYVIAHEVGHLLLGEHSHSNNGIMQARWQFEQLRQIAMGNLFFDSMEAEQLRVRARGLNNRSVGSPLASEAGN